VKHKSEYKPTTSHDTDTTVAFLVAQAFITVT